MLWLAGNLNLSNNKIINVGAATSDKDALSRVVADGRYLKLAGDTITGQIFFNNNVLASNYQALSRTIGNAYFVQIHNPYVYNNFNITNHRIKNLADPRTDLGLSIFKLFIIQ